MSKKEMSTSVKIATLLGVGSLALGACNLPGAPDRPATPTLKPTVTGTPTAETFSQEEVETLMAEAVLTDVAGRPVEVVTATPEPTQVWTMTPEASPTLFPAMASTELVEKLDGQIEAGETFKVAGWDVTFSELAFADRGDGTTFIEGFYPQVENLQGLGKMMEFWRMFPDGFTEKELISLQKAGYNYEKIEEGGQQYLKLGDYKVKITNHGDGEYGFPEGFSFLINGNQFCGEKEDECNLTLPAGHITTITGECTINEFDYTSSEDGMQGHITAVIEFGDSGSVNGMFDNVNVQQHPFHDGDSILFEGLIAKIANDMMNQDTLLNDEEQTNQGANCSTVDGCKTLGITLIFVSGNAELGRIETTISK